MAWRRTLPSSRSLESRVHAHFRKILLRCNNGHDEQDYVEYVDEEESENADEKESENVDQDVVMEDDQIEEQSANGQDVEMKQVNVWIRNCLVHVPATPDKMSTNAGYLQYRVYELV